ncbi:MAG: hypothetical protein Kow0068_18890 [Marinilabiliales bacterium]
MVAPIHIISIALGVAFLLGLTGKLNVNIRIGVTLASVAALTLISGMWAWKMLTNLSEPVQVFTAGFKPPFSINLQMGPFEAVITLMINFVGLFGGLYLFDVFKKEGKNSLMIYLVFLLGLNVSVMTRDIFNLFVFMEVSTIALAGLIILFKTNNSISAGFKYMIATGIISGFLLIGIVIAYFFAGSLNIDDLINADLSIVKGGLIAVFFIIVALLLETKPFPANGWGIDVYHSSHTGISALLSSASAPMIVYVIYKILPVASDTWNYVVAVTGMLSFVGSNFLAFRQTSVRRMLGYSSVAQTGLLLIIVGFKDVLGSSFIPVAAGLLLTNYFAKSGLFWLAGQLNEDNHNAWSEFRKSPVHFFLFGLFLFALAGFPPFPSFFAKWETIMHFAYTHSFWWIAGLLLGSFFEILFLIKWFGKATKTEFTNNAFFNVNWFKTIPVMIAGVGLLIITWFIIPGFSGTGNIWLIPIIAIAVLFVIDFLPAYVKNFLTIAAFGYYFYLIYPVFADDIIKLTFISIFTLGGIIALIPGFNRTDARPGYYPFVMMTFAGLAGIVTANTSLEFFFAWEFMAIGSYILILRGKNARKAAHNYIIFSVVSAFLIFAGFALAFASTGTMELSAITKNIPYANYILLLLVAGFLIKIAMIGLHIWLPDAYTEAEDDVTPFISGILINSGVYGLLFALTSIGSVTIFDIDLMYVLGWLGAITAIGGNMLAIYQEDIKKLIAYSSIGIMGYIIFALSMMSHLGWTVALFYVVVHFLYKTMLFLSAAGVIYRTKTRNMYEMGGLIKKMPISFLVVLIGIITLAGMPPLAGFAGKWIFYNAVILKGWYIQGTMVFFSGIVAFLYCYKLISAVFLGQQKDNLRKVKEAPIWYVTPQVLLIFGIMILSSFPNLYLKPLGEALSGIVGGEVIKWDGNLASTSVGYWNAFAIMSIVVGMFVVLLSWLIIMSRKPQKVKQFDIVYAGEKPFYPETTHVAYNIFAAYNKALGFLVYPVATKFWNWIDNIVSDIADHIRKFYNGNGQAYALHVILYIIIIYVFTIGGF